LQVPAGSVEPGEDLVEAVRREVLEETGLAETQVVRHLGRDEAFGCERHFFHLLGGASAAERWVHWERHRSDGEAEPIAFELFWWDLASAPPLAARQDAFLGALSAPRSSRPADERSMP
jgi:8-oxo-dGTP pyrophosphatase MutT (NUDIX family)